MTTITEDTELPSKFWERVKPEPHTGCWLWTGALCRSGYGRFRFNGELYAHRVAYRALVGDYPEGTESDHLCRVRNCVNPTHIEAVTHKVNTGRAFKVPGGGDERNRAKTHCPRGHEYAGANLYVNPSSGGRTCRSCQRAAQLTWQVANRDKVNAAHNKRRLANPELHRARCRASYHKKKALAEG